MKRKEFLKKSVFLGAGSMFLPTLSGYSTVNNSASNQINIGAIGINGMGWGNVQKALEVPGVKLIAICDVDENVIKRRLIILK